MNKLVFISNKAVVFLLFFLISCSSQTNKAKQDEKIKPLKKKVALYKPKKTNKAKTIKIPKRQDFTKQALKLIKLIKQRKYEEFQKYFDKKMQSVFPIEKQKAVWEQLEKYYGKIEITNEFEKKYMASYQKFSFKVNFSKKNMILNLILNNKAQVSGLFISPGKDLSVYKLPKYVESNNFKEKKVSFKNKEFELPGFVVIPQPIHKQIPCVVFVHGSGPQDADETIGPNKPFKDLALGLAKLGIASFRYVKRTKQYAAKISMNYHNMTLEKITVNDAVKAFEWIRSNAKQYHIDPTRIFIIGHSLGGYASPFIVQKLIEKQLKPAGIIILAGNTGKLSNLIIKQTRYLSRYDGKITEMEKEHLRRIEQSFKELDNVLKNKNKIDLNSPKLYFNLPITFWFSLSNYHPIKTLKNIFKSDKNFKVIVMRGARDYQVGQEDVEVWKKADKSIIIKTYTLLNHLFIKGQGKPNPSEYMNKGHIAFSVIQDIADFINKH